MNIAKCIQYIYYITDIHLDILKETEILKFFCKCLSFFWQTKFESEFHEFQKQKNNLRLIKKARENSDNDMFFL